MTTWADVITRTRFYAWYLSVQLGLPFLAIAGLGLVMAITSPELSGSPGRRWCPSLAALVVAATLFHLLNPHTVIHGPLHDVVGRADVRAAADRLPDASRRDSLAALARPRARGARRRTDLERVPRGADAGDSPPARVPRRRELPRDDRGTRRSPLHGRQRGKRRGRLRHRDRQPPSRARGDGASLVEDHGERHLGRPRLSAALRLRRGADEGARRPARRVHRGRRIAGCGQPPVVGPDPRSARDTSEPDSSAVTRQRARDRSCSIASNTNRPGRRRSRR